MAYWMFAGELPFDGDDPVVLGNAVLTEPVEPIAGLPKYMNAALLAALVGGAWWLAAGTTETTETTKTIGTGNIGTTSLSPVATEADRPKAGATKTLPLPGGATMEMIYVAPGSFMMGSPGSEDDRYDT